MPQKKPLVQIFLTRFLTLTLMLNIGVTHPAFALRQAGLEESGVKDEFLKELGVLPGGITVTNPRPTAGLEELETVADEVVEAFQGILGGWVDVPQDQFAPDLAPALGDIELELVRSSQERGALRDEISEILRWWASIVGTKIVVQRWRGLSSGNEDYARFLKALVWFQLGSFQNLSTQSQVFEQIEEGLLSVKFLQRAFELDPLYPAIFLFNFTNQNPEKARDSMLQEIRDAIPKERRPDYFKALALQQGAYVRYFDALGDNPAPWSWEEARAPVLSVTLPRRVAQLHQQLTDSKDPRMIFWKDRINPESWADANRLRALLEWMGKNDFPVSPDVMEASLSSFIDRGISVDLQPAGPIGGDSEEAQVANRAMAQMASFPAIIAALQILLERPDSWPDIERILHFNPEPGGLSYVHTIGLKLYPFSDADGEGPDPEAIGMAIVETGFNPYGNTRFFTEVLPASFLDQTWTSFQDYANAVVSARSQYWQAHRPELVPPATAGLEEVGMWIQRLGIWSKPLEATQLVELQAQRQVVAEVRGVPAVVQLTETTQGVIPSVEISKGRQVIAQSGLLPDQTVAALTQRFGAVEPLPRPLTPGAISTLVSQLRELDAKGPKTLLIVDTDTAEQLKAILSEADPEWQVPAVILGAPSGLLATTDPEAVLTYLLNLLAQVDPIPGRHMERLEATLTLDAQRQTFFLSTGA